MASEDLKKVCLSIFDKYRRIAQNIALKYHKKHSKIVILVAFHDARKLWKNVKKAAFFMSFSCRFVRCVLCSIRLNARRFAVFKTTKQQIICKERFTLYRVRLSCIVLLCFEINTILVIYLTTILCDLHNEFYIFIV